MRVFNNTMRDFLAGVGATAVSMAFAEVVPALQHGVVDCGVTGSLSGNTAGWAEVTKSIYPMSLGWSINVLAVNLDSWKRLDPKTQAFLLEQFKAYEDKMWATIRTTTAEADNCNTGKQPCTMGKLAKTTIVRGEARGDRDAQEAGRGRGAGGLGQALRRRMHQGMERDRRQGARPDGADAVSRSQPACGTSRNGDAGVRRFSRVGRIVGGAMLLLAAVLICIDMLLRKFLARSIGGADELSGYALAIATRLGLRRGPARSLAHPHRLALRAVPAAAAAAARSRSLVAVRAASSRLIDLARLGRACRSPGASGSRSQSAIETPLVIPQALWFAGLLVFVARRRAAAAARPSP